MERRGVLARTRLDSSSHIGGESPRYDSVSLDLGNHCLIVHLLFCRTRQIKRCEAGIAVGKSMSLFQMYHSTYRHGALLPLHHPSEDIDVRTLYQDCPSTSTSPQPSRASRASRVHCEAYGGSWWWWAGGSGASFDRIGRPKLVLALSCED